MDKKRIGAIVGAVGVAGALTASYFLKMDSSQAEFVTKDLAAQYNASLRDSEKALDQGSEGDNKDESEQTFSDQEEQASEKVYDPVQKIEYLVAKAPEELEQKGKDPIQEDLNQESQLEESEIAVKEEKEEEKPTFDRKEVEKFIGIVDTDVLNVRADTNTDAEVVALFARNEVVRGTIDGDWVALEERGGLIGYVNKNFLKQVTEEEAKAQEAANIEEARRRAEEEKAEAERKAEEEKLAAERKAEEEKLAAEKAEAKKKADQEAAKAKEEESRAAAEKEAEAKRQAQAEAKAEEERKKAEAEEKESSVSGFVRVDSANVRSAAGQDASILASVNANYPIEGTKKGGWIRFDYHGQTGYIADFLVGDKQIEISASKTPKTYAKQQAEIEAAKPKDKAGYVNTSANVRKGPGTSYDVIKTVAINTYIEGQESNGWVKFDLDGQEAYISAFLLSDNKLEEAPAAEERNSGSSESNSGGLSAVLEYANSKIGCSYVYGEAGPNAFDCSGLVQSSFRQAGVRLPHSSRAQYGYGYAVSIDNLQAGDLLFFASGDRIDHVAIYIGNGRMVHASTPATGVRVDSIRSPWYTSRFVGARRIFN